MNNGPSQGFAIVTDCAARAGEIAEITRAAFQRRFGAGDGEAALIAALRADGDVVVELAALEAGAVVGHAMFSRAAAEPALCHLAALAPVAVRIDRQGQGIGDSLIRAGIAFCRDKGIEAAIVLGDPAYYGRFGFRVETAAPLACAYAGPHFQAVEFRAGALRDVRAVSYARAFQSPGL